MRAAQLQSQTLWLTDLRRSGWRVTVVTLGSRLEAIRVPCNVSPEGEQKPRVSPLRVNQSRDIATAWKMATRGEMSGDFTPQPSCGLVQGF